MLSYLFYGLTRGVANTHTSSDRVYSEFTSCRHFPEPLQDDKPECPDVSRERADAVQRLKRIFTNSPSTLVDSELDKS